MAIDPKNKITEEQYQQVLKEEFAAMLREYLSAQPLEEGIMDSLKGGAKKIGSAYVKLFKAYADILQSEFGQEPPADVPTPQEMGQELAQGDEAGADGELNDFQRAIQDLAKDPKIDAAAQDIVNKIMGQAQQVDDKLGGDEEGAQEKTPDSDKLLDLLDKVMDEWDAIQNKTSDKNLKKSMDYIEKVAVAEQKEKSQNG
tara:strand:+ start:665 stop:1264 length:600 start_codon:yes stop_codon:yes gene_type:complete